MGAGGPEMPELRESVWNDAPDQVGVQAAEGREI